MRKNRLGKALALFLALMLCISATPAFAANAAAGAWYDGAVRYVTENALLSARADGGFAPDEAISPTEFTAALQKLGGAVAAPTGSVLARERAVALLYDFAVSRGVDVSVGEDTNILSYHDALDISEGLFSAMQWACGAGLVNGTGDGNLDPAGVLTRAQAAALLYRFCTRVGSYPVAPLVGTPLDYADRNNWALLSEPDEQVDTFYIYPTVFISLAPDAPEIAPIDNAFMRTRAQFNLDTNCGVFSASTNVFAPYYRQSNLTSIIPLSGDALVEYQRQEQRTDIYAALDYYFEHLNGGRPFILAGHSQGSVMLKIALREYFQAHPEYYQRMIAAYVLGYSITTDDLAANPALRFAEGADDTGVIVSWNVEGPDNGDNFVVEENALSINPLNWQRDETYAPASLNLGTRVVDSRTQEVTEYLPGIADARVDTARGVVVCTAEGLPYISSAGIADTNPFGERSYHNGDYQFYYYNIMENVKTRVAAWFLKHEAHTVAPLVGTPTDYAEAENWIAQPEPEKPVDTFYVYPTSYIPTEADAPMICDVDNAGMRAMAKNNFNTNKGAYDGSTNVFAPYYRQTSVTALQDYGAEGAAEILSREPRTDLYAALDYYFEHLNGGRPFILAGHSQGSMLLRIVLKEYMAAHPEYYARMVAAYVIGYSVTQEDLSGHPWLRFAECANDTGVIVSWNTEGPDNGESRLVLPGAISINPINWKRDDTYANADENLGSLVDGELVTPGIADARVDTERGVVVCTADLPYIDVSRIAAWPVFGEKSFHGNDYTFYYANLQKNVADRVAAYLAKNGAQ